MSQSYAYDKLNRLTSVSENGAVIAAYTYDNKGNRIQSISNGETTTYTYNLANMLTSQVTGEKLSEAYTYYLNGNQKTKVSNGETTTYTYDGMNRLVSENDTLYTFDDFGNRATMTDGEATTSYTYDLNNRLTESVEVNGDITTTEQYFYDNNGNQISKVVSATHPSDITGEGDYSVSDVTDNYVALYEYNCYNQLVYANTDGVVSTYTYAPDGLRASKTVGDVVTMFVYDSANIIEEIVGADTNKYYRGIGIIKNGDGLYYLYNGQGDVAMLTNADGAVVANYTFDAYGNAQQENTVYNPFGYRGEYADSETGFIYLRARYYDPRTGRFINEDPIRDGLNWYVYANSNPVMYVDPRGLSVYPLGSDEEKIYIKNQLKNLSNDKIYLKRDENSGILIIAYEPGEKIDPFTQLIREIIDAPYACMIKVGDMKAGTDIGFGTIPIIRGDASRIGVGTGSTVYISKREPQITAMRNGKMVKVTISLKEALWHELCHVKRNMEGKAIPYESKGDLKFRKGYAKSITGEYAPIEEFETVGIPYFKKDGTLVTDFGDYTENTYREWKGLDPRRYYP